MSRNAGSSTRLGFAIVVLVGLSWSQAAKAANIIWNGGTGVWSTGTNWVGGVAPGSADTATFSGSTTACSITSSVSVAAIAVSVGVTITASSGVSVTTSGAFSQSLGTFNGGDSTNQIGGALALSGGTFNSTTGLLLLGGFNATAGTFNANGGRIVLAGTGSQTFATNGVTFNNLSINDSLVGYWKLDDGSGGTAVDSSGYGGDLSSNAATWATSSGPTVHFTNPSYLSFNGVASGPSKGLGQPRFRFSSAQSFTLSAWVNAGSASYAADKAIVVFGRDSTDWYGIWISKTSSDPAGLGKSRFMFGGAAGSSYGGVISAGWHHVAVVQTGSTSRKIYVDGIDTTYTSYSSQIADPTGTLTVGYSSAGGDTFDGGIDDIRLYSRVLSASEISTFASGNIPAGGTATQSLTGNPTIAGTLVIASGTLAAQNTSISVAGNFWNYGGIFTTGASGSVTFNGSASGNSILTGGQAFNNVTISGTGAWTVADDSAVNLKLTGSYTQSAGTFTAGNGLLNIAGAFNKTAGTFNGGSGTVMLTSATSQNLTTTGTTTFNNLTINDGLVGYWKLDEGSGTSTADSSGYGNTGTLGNSPTWITSGLPTLNFTDAAGLSLNGTTNYVALGTNGLPSTNAAQTISLWAKLNATGGQQNLVALTNLSTAGVQIEVNGTNLGAYNWGAGTLVATAAPSTGTWHHIAYTYDGASHQTLYIDGTATTATVTNQTGSVTAAYLGTYSPNSSMFNGSLDEVRIYSRVLTAAEISALANGYQPATYSATQTMTGSPTVSGDLTLASGFLAMGANTISLAGNWWNYGGALSATYWGGAAINLTGSGTTNTIRSGGQFLPSLNLTGSGAWTLADNLDVDPNATVTMTTGSLNLSSRTLRTGALASGSGTLTTTGATVILDGNSNHTLSVTPQNNLRIEDPSETNLVGYWKFDETQGSSARDWTGLGHTATLVNAATWGSSVPPKVEFYDPAALKLASSGSQYADAGASTNFVATNAAFSACGWVNYTSLSSFNAVISFNGASVAVFTVQRDSTGPFNLDMRSSDSTGAALYHIIGSTTVATGTWYHVCGVFDGSKSHLYVNGTEEGTAQTIGVTWNASGHLTIGTNIYSGTLGDYTNGTIDDVRVYNVALTAAQVIQLANGRYANTGGTPTVTLGGSVTANGAVNIDSGTLDPGSHTLTATGGLTVRNAGTLQLDTASGAVALGSAATLTVDGTLYASTSSAAIKSASGRYTLQVGSTATATPTLNINGLTVSNTDSNGVLINGTPGGSSGAATTFTELDRIAFGSGTGNQLLNAYASSLYLTSNACTFDGTTTYAIKLSSTAASGTGPRLLFGNATCATNDPTTGLCAASEKQDNEDANHDGLASPATGGVVEFVRAAESDTHGTIAGFPTAAFNWNTFAYYSTYVAFNSASSGTDVVYVRDEGGNPLYSWTDPNLISGGHQTVTGTPLWTTVGSTHYLYVAVNGSSSNTGGVYRLVDNGATLTLDTTWPTATHTGYYPCSCTITSDAQLDANNVYWAATTSGGQMLFGITQTAGVVIKTGWPVTAPANVTSSAPVLVTATSSLYLGVTAMLAQLNFTSLAWTQDAPTGMGTINGRVNYGTATSAVSRIYVGDASGKLWGVSPSAFSGTNYLWSYSAGSAVTDNYYDYLTDTVQFGTASGTVVSLTGAGSGTSGVVVNSGYPYAVPGADPITTAPLFYAGILVVGTTKGNLYFLNRNTGPSGTPANSVAILKAVNFGPTESVSSIGFDFNVNRYMVSTSSAANDGRLYYFDLITDPDSTR